MSLRNQSITALLAAGLVACGGTSFEPRNHELASGAPVRITVEPGDYRAGTTVPLVVRNLGDVQYVWNPCMRTLERNVGGEWLAGGEPERVCNALGWILDPGKHTETTTDLAESLPAGEYRFRYGFSRRAGDFNVTDLQVSNSFTVAP